MSLQFAGPGGDFETRWIVYACLRDNVQHHLEGGLPTERFAALHGAAEALGGSRVVLSASRLRAEIIAARAALSELPYDEFAISSRTRAAVFLTGGARDDEPTRLLMSPSGAIRMPLLHHDVRVLGEVCGPLMNALVELCEGGPPDAQVTVVDL